MGWLFRHDQRGSRARYAPDLLADPAIRFVDRTFVLWALGGLALPFALGVAIGGILRAGLTGLLWGGAVRMFVLHHVTYSINSICHVFGRRRFGPRTSRATCSGSRCSSFGESWHNNHHAFPTSARHGLGRWQLDPSALVIRGARGLRAGVGRRAREPASASAAALASRGR